jgi:hypothetical protein
MAYVVSNTGATEKIKNELPFRNRNATLVGTDLTGLDPVFGRLPDQYRDAVRQARYVVYSYLTPIGWVSKTGEKTVPDVGYSLTTSQHQYAVAHAWGVGLPVARGRELRPAGTGTREGYFGSGV